MLKQLRRFYFVIAAKTCTDFNIFSKYLNLFTESIGALVMMHEPLFPSALNIK